MWGERLFGGPARTGPPDPPAPELVAELAAAAGLPGEFAPAADDESWDAALSDSLDAASKACGPYPLSPTIVLDESLTGLSGPVSSPAPTGEAALRAWDAVRVLLAEPGFFELRRARAGPPAFAADSGRSGTLQVGSQLSRRFSSSTCRCGARAQTRRI